MSVVVTEARWDREQRSLPRNIAGLAAYFKACSVPVSDRYIHRAISKGGYTMEFGNLTSADHFLKWKRENPTFRCGFPQRAGSKPKPPHPARPGARGGKSDAQ